MNDDLDSDIATAVLQAGEPLPAATRARMHDTLTNQMRSNVSGPARPWRRWIVPVMAGAAAAALVAMVVVASTNGSTGRRLTPATIDSAVDSSTVTSGVTRTPTLDDLRGHRWVLIDWNGATPPPYTDLPFIEFVTPGTGDGFLTGYDGCNWFTAQGSFDGQRLAVVNPVTTARSCVPGVEPVMPSSLGTLQLSPSGFAFTLSPLDGSSHLGYGRLDSLQRATADSLPGSWSARRDAQVVFDVDGTGTVGTCTFTWVMNPDLQISDWPNATKTCQGDPGAWAALARIATDGPVDAYVTESELYLSSPARTGSVVRFSGSPKVPTAPASTTTSAPTAPSADLPQRLADWPVNIAALPLAEVPTLLPDLAIPGAAQAVRTEIFGGDAPTTIRRYGQTWYDVQRAARLEITTTLGPVFPADPNHRQDLDASDWPTRWTTAYLATPKMAGQTLLLLTAPEGTVRLYSIGLSEQETIDIAKSLQRRPLPQPGWDATVPPGLKPIAEGGNADLSWRGVNWNDANGSVIAQLDINSDYPEAMTTGWYESSTIDTIDISGATAIVAIDGQRVAINWEIAPRIRATFGYLGDRATAEAIVRSLRPVDLATWEAAAEPPAPGVDGCHSLFC